MSEDRGRTTCPTAGCVQELRPPNYQSHAPYPCVEITHCPTCGGTGVDERSDGEDCEPCGGFGSAYQPLLTEDTDQ